MGKEKETISVAETKYKELLDDYKNYFENEVSEVRLIYFLNIQISYFSKYQVTIYRFQELNFRNELKEFEETNK